MLQVSKRPGAISNNSIFDIQQYSAKNVNPSISKLIGKIFIIFSLSEFLTKIERNDNLWRKRTTAKRPKQFSISIKMNNTNLEKCHSYKYSWDFIFI